jgi:hypothetical protein
VPKACAQLAFPALLFAQIERIQSTWLLVRQWCFQIGPGKSGDAGYPDSGPIVARSLKRDIMCETPPLASYPLFHQTHEPVRRSNKPSDPGNPQICQRNSISQITLTTSSLVVVAWPSRPLLPYMGILFGYLVRYMVKPVILKSLCLSGLTSYNLAITSLTS